MHKISEDMINEAVKSERERKSENEKIEKGGVEEYKRRESMFAFFKYREKSVSNSYEIIPLENDSLVKECLLIDED